jgi:hypothetical protein
MQLWEGKPFPPPSSHYNALDSDLEAICLKAAALNPDDRYQSMEEFACALEGYLKANLIASVKEEVALWPEDRGQDVSAAGSISRVTPQILLAPPGSKNTPLPVKPVSSQTESISETPDTQPHPPENQPASSISPIRSTRKPPPAVSDREESPPQPQRSTPPVEPLALRIIGISLYVVVFSLFAVFLGGLLVMWFVGYIRG